MGLAKKIAYRLQTLREAAGLSQQEVAEKAELSLSLIAKMEQGRKADPRASTLLALAFALGVRAGQLIEDLTKPPADTFPSKKKGKKKGKRLAALVGAGGEGEGGDAGNFGTPVVSAPEPEEPKVAKKKKKKKSAPAAV